VRTLQGEKDGKKNIIHVLCKHRDFFLSADTKQQQEDWFDIIDVTLKTYNISSENLPEVKTGYLLKEGKNIKVGIL